VVALAGVLSLVASQPAQDPDDPELDVDDAGCWIDPASGVPQAVVRVENDDEVAADYEIEVWFEGAEDESLGIVTVTPRLASGETSYVEVEGEGPTDADRVSCRVSEVQRVLDD
jgi:hypothetical protein